MKTCAACKAYQDLSLFGIDRNKKDGKNVYCKKCVREQSRERQPFRIKRPYDPIRAAKYRNSHSTEKRAKIAYDKRKSFLKQEYGISMEQYQKMLTDQDNKCAICERHSSTLRKTLAVDHNHINGKVRGLVCAPCNRTLGYLKIDETDKFVQNIISYFKRNR
ncbi:MAG: hypothetical protein HC840_01040 [Leptolyngbyaceae cyanobacterium RM2_2_4]|nr:hypothetical protein [Leptolyngbyaceae cyanobacterium RM2_2_4]